VSTVSASATASPPGFLRTAGHPLRWQLLAELAHSDRHVRELIRLTGRPQSLVSYHLGLLRADGLVSTRRSAADGRAAYYSLDLSRCGALLAQAGEALHPGLRLAPTPLVARASPRARVRVLFLCTGNSARSQMAEALADRLGAGAVEAFSAGSHPKPLHPNAVRVMRERGIDLRGRRSKHFDELAPRRFRYVVTLCDRVREVCPELPSAPVRVHWSMADPAREGDDDKATYPAFERTAAELERRIPYLLERIRRQEVN
jgi:ArsR family transcriptional regulator, arsenate/arsenite/antimonite-responsive transcriptional repressor / arsenate reductase (thioredoxin)